MSVTVNSYDLGDLVRVTAAFTNTAGTAIDPAAVFFQAKDPNGTLTEYTYGTDVELVRDSLGNYHADVAAAAAGTWHYRFYSTGSGQAAETGSFTVERSEFA